jgi:hypothetical protein
MLLFSVDSLPGLNVDPGKTWQKNDTVYKIKEQKK